MSKEMSPEETEVLDTQVQRWLAEMRLLAALVTTAKGGNCAIVMIESVVDDDGAEPIAPELVLEDALRVVPHGWPDGFNFDVLNASK